MTQIHEVDTMKNINLKNTDDIIHREQVLYTIVSLTLKYSEIRFPLAMPTDNTFSSVRKYCSRHSTVWKYCYSNNEIPTSFYNENIWRSNSQRGIL